ncbi:MAG: agmatinase [Bacteroidetes bacterium]|nr:agmatinase [Bacteroidota bacterium]
MKFLSNKNKFLELEDGDISYNDAKAVIVPFGLEYSTSYGKGTKNAPNAILKASQYIELFDEEFWLEPCDKMKFFCLEEPKIKTKIEDALIQVNEIVSKILIDNKFPIIIGGEHSLTSAAIKPFVNKYDEIIILHFDAHTDLRNQYQNKKYSHACAMRRCLDYKNIKILSLGIRSTSKEEIDYYVNNKDRIKVFWAKDKENWDINEIISFLKNKNVYLTFDVDVIDSSLMPATGTPEPGGLSWYEVINTLKPIIKNCNIVGCDFVEFSPIESFHAYDFLISKLIYKILSYIFYL